MNAERMREFLLGLPNVHETQQFGGLVYWVADKAIGGKMFSMINPDGAGLPMSFPVDPERFAELIELEGVRPAPYLARANWVATERWDVFRESEWESDLRAAHELTFAKLPSRTKDVLTKSKAEQRQIIAARRKALAEKEVSAAKV